MPKGGKKGVKKNSYVNYSCTDIKLEDFANSYVSAVRRKPTVNSLAREVKTLCTLERSWFENDVAELVSFATEDVGDNDDEEEATSSTHGRRKSKAKKGVSSRYDGSGASYPLDVWFLIAKYIRPEDVRVFASVCKASYFVSQTYTFWIGLYRRYYKTGTQLPLRLQPHCIRSPRGLKVCVIRALYYFYPQFSSFLTSPYSKDVYQLLKFVCVSMWHTQANSKWIFCFKFQSQALNSSSKSTPDEGHRRKLCQWDAYEYQDDTRRLLTDVNRNPEEGCKVLKITSPHFIASPVVMGARLADVKFGLTRDLIKQKLQLVFSFSNYKQAFKSAPLVVSRRCGGTGEVLEFDPIDNAVVLDWWHPQYPAGNMFS